MSEEWFQHRHPHPPTRARLFNTGVRNIVVTHTEALEDAPQLLREGYKWYDMANDTADKIARGNTVMGAGIIAALSPRKQWDVNVASAQKFINTGATVHTGTQMAKAQQILAGQHPLDVLKGMKERSFFQNIINPDDPEPVTIDRHAHDIRARQVFGEADRGLEEVGRYRAHVGMYRTAAEHLGVDVPSRLQAALWAVHTAGQTRFS